LQALYDQFVSGDEFDVAHFFRKLDVDPSGLESLIVFGMMELDNFADITKSKFVNGFAKCGCSNLKQIKQRITPIQNAMLNKQGRKVKVLKGFARWLFEAAKQDPRQRTLQTELIMSLLELVCPSSHFPLQPAFADFFAAEATKDNGDRKTCSRDDWVMVVEFLASADNFDNFSDDAGWPLIIGECYAFTTEATN